VTALVGRTRGFFFLSHHPWVGVVILVAIIALVLYVQRRDRP